MAMKKAKTTKKGALKKPPKKPADPKCNMPNICRYIEQLDNWLRYQFIPDYTALRKAVCNVEKQAFSNSGVNAKPPKFCTGGPGNEPPPPPPPPVW